MVGYGILRTYKLNKNIPPFVVCLEKRFRVKKNTCEIFFYSFGGFCFNQNIKSINKIIIIILKPFCWWPQNADRVIKLYNAVITILQFYFQLIFSPICLPHVKLTSVLWKIVNKSKDERIANFIAKISHNTLYYLSVTQWYCFN